MREIYTEVAEVLCEHKQLNINAMAICQSLGYNGFKRLHRCLSKKMMCAEISLINNFYDKYRDVFLPPHATATYAPRDLKSHLMEWDKKLLDGITKLGDANKKHFEKVGVENCVIKDIMECMLHDYEKCGRWYKRFEETSWLAHDLHVLDDRLHDKLKKIEESGNPY